MNSLPDMLFFGSILATLVLDRFMPVLNLIPEPFSYAGWILVVGGCMLAVHTMAKLKAGNASTDVVRTSDALLTNGPYAFSRNPLYLAELVIIMGAAFVSGSLGVWIAPLIYVAGISFFIIPLEERKLQAKFGRKYDGYKRKVRRWV